jgi:hypothetical protein
MILKKPITLNHYIHNMGFTGLILYVSVFLKGITQCHGE